VEREEARAALGTREGPLARGGPRSEGRVVKGVSFISRLRALERDLCLRTALLLAVRTFALIAVGMVSVRGVLAIFNKVLVSLLGPG
jgi:hypothetical protein